jgi:signal transduction histidine kinase/ActR/RegA family two-component response regulator
MVATHETMSGVLPADVAASRDDGGVQLSFSLMPAGPHDRRVAYAVLALSVAVFLASLPFAKVMLAPVPAFIPGYQAAFVVNDLITATLLFGQFRVSRSRCLYVLANGYVFTAVMAFLHQFTYPGVYSATGLFGAGSQTTAWMYMFWHGGFPLFVIAYAVVKGRDFGADRRPMRPGVAISCGIVAVLCIACALLAVAAIGNAVLPPVIDSHNVYTTGMLRVIGVVWGLSVLAVVVVWRRRPQSVLDLWLVVVMCAWVFDIGLSAVFNGGRFDFGFYAGRLYGLLASGFVLAVLLVETRRLHGALAAATERLSDYAGKLEERVKERTAELERTNAALTTEIDERQKTSAQLVHAQKMDAIGNLTGGIAHDFNNLLGVVIGNLGILLDVRKEDAEVVDLAGDAIEAATRGSELTRQLLAFARRQPLQPRRVDVNELVGTTTKLLRRTLGENINISLELGSDPWPVMADPNQLEAAITNLAMNARDAMPKGGRLVIATGGRYLDADYAETHSEVTPGDYTLIEVSDSGTGIPADLVGKIFEPFFTTKERGKGTGLGLSMVFGFVKQSGGHISVYSEVGVGTTFRLYLPCSADSDVAKAPRVAAEITQGRGEKVLAVEDNPAMRKIVTRLLHEIGYQVVVADTAAAALAILERETVDLLFTDLIMPGPTTGLDIARIAMKRWPAMRVVLTSGFPQGNFSDDLQLLGTARLLSKPYRKDELARTLRAAFEEPVARQGLVEPVSG